MSDPATDVATLAVCIAILATVVAWFALDSARLAHKAHRRLHEEFWKQAIRQAEENGRQWGFQIRQAEAFREHLGIGTVRLVEKPKPPLN